MSLRLNSALRPAALNTAFRTTGRLHIPDFLDLTVAETLYHHLTTIDWRLVTLGGGQHYDLPSSALDALDPARKSRMLSELHQTAETGFHYLYDNYPLADLAARGDLDPLLSDVTRWICHGAFLDAARAITGDDRIAFADVQATRYRPGHYLTTHDDGVVGKNRLYAYVLNLTPQWRADWGGQLQFFGPDGHVDGAYIPAFNALNIFAVPYPHAVSIVAPFAAGDRISLTGWVREGRA